MALVDIPGRASLEVPDNWGRDEVTDFVRQSYPDLFEPASADAGPSAVTLGPDRAPLSPAERQARISSIRGTPAENRQFDQEQSRIADLDALEAARESGGLSGFLSSDIMAGPRRVAAGAANFLRVPGTIANIQLAPFLAADATRPAAERIAQLLSDMDRGITGAQEQLRVSERPDSEPSLADVFRSGRDIGPLAAAADLGTLGVNAIADSAAYIIPGGAVAKALQGAGIGMRAAGILGPMISVAPVETADALSEYLDAGAIPVAARIAAPIVGFINGALESITDSKLLARLGGGDAAKKGAAKFLVGQILGEGLTEGLQEEATVAGRALLTGSPGPDVANRVGTAVAGGMFGGAGLGGAVELANRITAPAPLTARGVPVDVARAELTSGEVPTGSVPIASAPVEGALGAVRDYAPPLGKRKRKAVLNFARIAEEEGVADLVDFIPEAKKTAEGASVEGEFIDGRFRVYVPNIRNENRLRGTLREEKAHGWIATEPGQVALTDFIARNPLTDAERTKLQAEKYLQLEGEDDAQYVRRLSDEFVAKLNRDPKWKQWVGEAVAWVKEKIGVSLTNAQAGRLMLRNLRKVGAGAGQGRQSMVGWGAVPGQPPASKSPEVTALEQKWAESGVRLQVSETPSGLVLNVIESPGKGLGGQALADVVRLSESRGVPVSLTASAQPGRAEDLARFYERAGFQKVSEDPLSKKPIYRRAPAPRFSLAPEKADTIVTDDLIRAISNEDGDLDVAKLSEALNSGLFARASETGRALLAHLIRPSDKHPISRIVLLDEPATYFQGRFATKSGSKVAKIDIALRNRKGGRISQSQFVRTLNHELVHNSVTSKLDAVSQDLRRRATRLFEFARENAPAELLSTGVGKNAFKNLSEFFAEALSSRQMREYLIRLDYSKQVPLVDTARSSYPDIQPLPLRQSAFGRLLSLARQILGIPSRIVDKWTGASSEAISALDEAVSLAGQAETYDRPSQDGLYAEAPSTPRFSLSPEKATTLLDSIRTEFPSAPPIIVGDPDPRGAYYDGANIVVSPGDLPGNPAAARATILSALVESRLMLRNLRRTGGQSGGQSRQSLDVVGAQRNNLPEWAREEMVRRGMDPKRILNDVDLGNPSVQEAIRSDPSLTDEQKSRLLSTGSLRQSTPRFSLAPDRLPKIVDSIRAEFPSAPPIIEGPPDPRGAYYDGSNIVVSAPDLSGNPASARSAIVSALVESGLDVFGPTFVADTYAMLRETDPVGTARIAERLAANPKTPEGQRSILGEVLRLQGQESRLRPWVRKWMRRLRLSPTDELSRNLERLARTTLAAYEIPENLAGGRATPAAQVYANLNHAVWAYAKPIVDRLRNLAIDERFAAEDEKAFRNMGNRMRALGDSGRARDIGAGVERPWNPRSETFIEDLRAADIPTTDADERLHAAFRLEAEARDLVRTLDAIDDLTELLSQLERSAPNFDRTEDLARLAALRKEIAEADPGALARAGDLRLHAARKWESRAAQMVMLDPQIQAWLEIVERIEQSGATPQEASGNLADAAEVARDTLFLSWRPFQKRTAQVYDDFMSTTYPERLRALRTRLEDLTGDRVRAHVAVGEILASLRGVMGLSGSTEDRATAEFLAENDEQLRRFIVALAQADPDSAVARFRDRVFRRLDSDEADLRAVAAASGISVDATVRLVDLIRESDGRRNAVVEAYGAVDRSITESALAAIRGVEQGGSAEAAAPAIARFVRARGRAIDALTGVEQDISQLEGRRVALEMLRDAGATEVPTPETGATEMVYDANDGGVLFREFTKADGSEQPAIRLLPGEEYTGDLLTQLVDWQRNAEEAVAAGSNPEPVTRGLRVAVPMTDFYIDAKFTRDQISSTIAPTRGMDRTGGSPFTLWLNIGTRETLSKLVPGVQGRRLKAKLAGYVKAGQVIDKLTRKHVRKNRELMIAAAESLGLDLRNEGDPALLQRARNEVSHRVGRQFSSGLGVGDRLISLPGRTITPELLNLLRNDRAVGREAQAEELRRPYGGVRVQLPGERVVRRPGETGDFGLARLPRPAVYQRLAEVYRTKDPLQIAAFWDSAESQQGLLWHILDSGRADLGVERDGDLIAAEQRIANRIFQGAPAPRTLDEAVSLLTAESGLTRAEVRGKLLKELEGYARIAAARVPAETGTSAKTSAIEAFGESDLTEFTQSAAPLMFPSSWYTYGMSDSLQAFLERTGDAAQVEFLTALQESAKELRTIATAIAEAQTLPEIEKAAVFAKYRGDILWHTNSDWSGTNIDKVRAQAAVKNMKLRADRLAAEIASIQAPAKAWHSSVQRGISNVIPHLLMWTGPAVANIVSGPWAGRFVNRPFLGTGVSTARAVADMIVGSPMHFAYDRLMALGQGMGLKFSEPEELQAYLEGAGILGSYSRAELGESEAWSRGEVTGGLGTRISQAGQEAANAISERVGVRLGDSVLNRYIARTMVPPIIWRMKRIAAVWKSRLAREGLAYDPANPLTLLTDADVGGSATLRDFLGTFGNPEVVLQNIQSVPVRTFWRSELGATIGSSILSQVNAATRGNRPTSNPLLSLLGWTVNMVNQIAADSRTVPDDGRLKKISQTTLRTLSWMALAAISAYWSTIARRSAQAGQTQLAEAIQQILMGLDDDDDEGLLDALTRLSGLIREHVPGAPLVFNAAARVAGAMKTPPPTGEPTPLDMSFWGQSPTEILKDIAFTVPKGVGLDLENPRLPAVGILSTVGQGLSQVGQAGWTIAHDMGPEGQAGAKADLKEGTRKVLSVFSMAGQFVYNMANPEAVVSKQVKSEIVEAARKIGLEPSKPPKFGSWLAPTPKEQALREAARRGDEEGMRNITGFAFRQAYNKAVEKGESPEQAQSAGEQAVKGLLVALDPIRDAVGGPITEEQYRKLQPLLGPKVREAMNQRARAVQVISERPPEGMRSFAPTPAMETPVKRTPGGRVSSSRGRGRRGRRPSFLARRRSAGRRVRRVRLRV